MEGRAIIVLAMLAVLLGAGGMVIASRPSVITPPELATTCPNGQFAQNETAAGAFQCKAVVTSLNGLNGSVTIAGISPITVTTTTSSTIKVSCPNCITSASGNTVLLYSDLTNHGHTISNAWTSIGASYTVAANSCAQIRVFGWGYISFTATSNIGQGENVAASLGGARGNPIVAQIAVAAGVALPWYVEYMAAFTGGGTATIDEMGAASVADANTTVTIVGFEVYCIV